MYIMRPVETDVNILSVVVSLGPQRTVDICFETCFLHFSCYWYWIPKKLYAVLSAKSNYYDVQYCVNEGYKNVYVHAKEKINLLTNL